MRTWFHIPRWSALVLGFFVIWLATGAPAQDPASPSTPPPAEAAPATEAPPEPAGQPPAETPVAAPQAVVEPVAAPADEPPPPRLDVDYARLAHPDVADQLELSEEQRTSLARMLNERAHAVSVAESDQRTAVAKAIDEQIAALLNDAQRAKLATLTAPQELRFNFRFQKWADVLDWFAQQADLTLVMDQPPPGEFTFSDAKSYTPTQAIDLLNSVLLTKGYTLIRRDRLLLLVNLSNGLPMDLIPRVDVDQLPERGSSEFVTVLFPLEGRPADTVNKEIQPLLGKHGVCLALPQTGQLLITETARTMRDVSIIIASIPTPKKPEKPKDPPPKPQPVLTVYPVKSIDVAKAVETLSNLFSNAKFTFDLKADQIMAFATPDEQAGIKAALDQMMANEPPEKKAFLETYQLGLLNTEQLEEQLEVAVPEAQVNIDAAESRVAGIRRATGPGSGQSDPRQVEPDGRSRGPQSSRVSSDPFGPHHAGDIGPAVTAPRTRHTGRSHAACRNRCDRDRARTDQVAGPAAGRGGSGK